MTSTSQKIHWSDDAYTIMDNIYSAMALMRFGNTPFKGLTTMEVLQRICGITHHATAKVIRNHNRPSEASEKHYVGRLGRLLDPEYSSAAEQIKLNNDDNDRINTTRRTLKTLKESYSIRVSYSVLLRDIHSLGFK